MVKRVVALAAVAAVGYFAYTRFVAASETRDLWTEAAAEAKSEA